MNDLLILRIADYILKTKLHFESDAAIAAALTDAAEADAAETETAGQRDGQISDGRAAVGSIKKIADLDGEFQFIRTFVIVAAAPLPTAAAAERAVGAGSIAVIAAFSRLDGFLFTTAKTEYFGGAQIDEEKRRSASVIARDDRVARIGRRVKCAESGDNDAGFGKTGRKRRTVIENRVAVRVGSVCDIKRNAGAKGDERTKPNAERYADVSAECEAMPNIYQRVSVFAADVILVGRKCARAVRIAFGAAERVIAENRNLLAEIRAEIKNQLILIKSPGRFVLKNIAGRRRRPDAVNRRVDIARAQKSSRLRENVGRAQSSFKGQLALDAQSDLARVGSLQIRCDDARRLRLRESGQRLNARHV